MREVAAIVGRLLSRKASSPRRYDLGLHFKLVLAGAVTTLFGIAAISTFLVYRHAAMMHVEIERAADAQRAAAIERARLQAKTMGASIEILVVNSDLTAIARVLDSVVRRQSDLAYALITDLSGTTVVHTDPARLGTKRAPSTAPAVTEARSGARRPHLFEVTQPLPVDGAPHANLVLGFDLLAIETRAAEARLRGEQMIVQSTSVASVAAAVATLLCICASILLSRRLLRPIVRLARDAATLADGNLEHEIGAVNSRDEIGFLAQQFEMMRRSIKAYFGALSLAKQQAEASAREERRLRAQIENHSKLLEARVQERTAELQQINAQLTEYDRMKSEFLNNVSHELRSPIAAIASAAKIIGRYGDVNRNTGSKFSSIILEESDRLGRLINDLLDLAKIESGRIEWNMERIENPAEVFGQVVDTYKPLAQERGITIELACASRLPSIIVDRDRLIQVLTNLCSNALKFTPHGGRIEISAEAAMGPAGKEIRAYVLDTGPGIPEDQLERVFDRFHQVQNKRDGHKPKGTGLGLAICREVITHHGGRIWAEAPAQGGARMVFSLPVADSTAACAAEDRRRAQAL